ncbi:hypothetical protein FQN54_001527 [Arachnomyces sp. PD_36]|nr:hypothetical protein FQN54_001527 [Arachnomyces sp. PD_36]
MAKPIQTLNITRMGSDASPIYQITPEDGSYTYTAITSQEAPHLTVTKQIQYGPPPYPGPPTSYRPTDSNLVYNQPISTVKMHTLSSKIDITLQQTAGREAQSSSPHLFSMKRPNPLTASRKFQTQTPLGTLEWKGESLMSSNQILLDGNGRVLARYGKKKSIPLLSSVKGETLQLCVPGLELYIDLIVTTGLASIEYKRWSDEDLDGVFDIF